MERLAVAGLHLRRPVRESWLPRGLWGEIRDRATYDLTDGAATFRFVRDDHSGLRLDSFWRAGGHTWQNTEHSLWQVTLFEALLGTIQRNEGACVTLEPTASDLVAVDRSGTALFARWEPRAGAEQLAVEMRFLVEDGALRVRCRAEWLTSPMVRYCVTSMAPLVLQIRPHDQGNDAACAPHVKGVVVRDPIHRFRWFPEDPALAATFGGRAHNFHSVGSGRWISMPLWGYYSEVDGEGWMCWHEGADDPLHSYFDANGEAMNLEHQLPQPEWATAGNPGQALGMEGDLWLRPMLCSAPEHGWWDVADQYRQRIDAERPVWWIPKWWDDETRSAEERRPFIWWHADTQAWSQDCAAEVVAALQVIRDNVVSAAEAQVLGLCKPNNLFGVVWAPGATPIRGRSDRDQFLAARAINAWLGGWKPSAHMADAHTQYPWGAHADPWTELSLLHSMRTDLRGQLHGDTLETKAGGSSADGFWASAEYQVISYDPATRVLEVSGPAIQWNATPIENNGATILLRRGSVGYRGELVSSTIHVDGRCVLMEYAAGLVLIGADGSEAAPAAGETLTIFDESNEYCRHAALGAARWRALALDGVLGARRKGYGETLFYLDIQPSANARVPNLSCSSLHTGWAELGPGYVPHPRGGGSWWQRALRESYALFRQGALKQRSPPFVWLVGEYLDERFLSAGLVIGGHSGQTLDLWRNYDRDVAAAWTVAEGGHGISCCPMFAVVHAGRALGMQFTFELGNSSLLGIFGRNDDHALTTESQKLRRQIAGWCFLEWAWGLTPAGYLHSATDSGGVGDISSADSPWDPAQYDAGHPLGAADPEVAKIRDLWTTICRAEARWIFPWFRQGRLRPPLQLGGSQSLMDVLAYGLFQPVAVGGVPTDFNPRNSSVGPWEVRSYPRVLHAAWHEERRGSSLLLMLNWTDTTGTCDVVLDRGRLGLDSEEHHVFAVDPATGALTALGEFWTSSPFPNAVPAYTLEAVLFVPERSSVIFRADADLEERPDPPPRIVVQWRHFRGVYVELRVTREGAPVDLTGALLREMIFTDPDGTEEALPATAVADPKSGRLRCLVGLNQWGQRWGVWTVEAYIDTPATGEAASFPVEWSFEEGL